MSSIVYLLRAPRYANLSIKEIRLIESYLQWRHNCKMGSQYASTTFEKWGGHSLKELPPMDAIKHFKPYFERERFDDEDDVEGYKCYGIFEQVGRFGKASQFYGWVLQHVLNDNKDTIHASSVEVSKDQLENLLDACNRVRRYAFKIIEADIHRKNCKYEVNEAIACEILPIMEINGHLMFPYAYDANYAKQILSAIKVFNEILSTTDFEKQTIYFQW